jgi:cytochrome c oxidase assembly protein subunit 15
MTARQVYGWLAWAALALTFAVVIASAFLRHSQAGLSCEPWPGCYARAEASDEPPSMGVRAARVIHRISATAVTAAILGLVLVAWTQRPVWLREGLVATGALAVAGALAVLGVVTAGSKAPAIVLGNLLGGHALLALVAAACAYAFSSRGIRWRARVLALSVLAAAFIVAFLGGSIGAQYASLSCPSLACDVRSMPSELLQAPSIVGGRLRAPDWAPALHVAHRIAAIVLVAGVLFTALVLRRERPRLAVGSIVAIAAAALLGMTAVSPQPMLAAIVAHNAAAAATLALVAAVCASTTR